MTGALSKVYFFLIGLFLAAPMMVVAGVSVNAKQTLAFPPKGFRSPGTAKSSSIRNGAMRCLPR